MKKNLHFIFVKFLAVAVLFLTLIIFTGCFSEKNSVLYDSEWLMENYDESGQPYSHTLTLSPNHVATLIVMYDDTLDGLCWTGKYKINSKKIVFDFTDCVRYKNGEIADRITSGKVIKFYAGEFFYSAAEIDIQNNDVGTYFSATEQKIPGATECRMQLIRPKNYFYGGNKDILGNQMDEFVKMN